MIAAFVIAWNIFFVALSYHDIKHGDDIKPMSKYPTACYTIYQHYYPDISHHLAVPRDTRSVICWQRSKLVNTRTP